MIDRARFEALAASDRALDPAGCEELARRAAELVDLETLDRKGEGSFELLWRDEHSEGWLNTWWRARDTGFHDHAGSCVGVVVLEGRARNEPLVLEGPRRPAEYAAGESFSFPGTGIHRMEHEDGAVTVHVYSPPIREIGHYEILDGRLCRTPGPPDEGSPPSPSLAAALGG